MVEIVAEHDKYHDTPDILSGHNQPSNDPDIGYGAVGLENTESGQHSIIRKLRQNGFVVTEIGENQFYIGKLKTETQGGSDR